jgi:hypothetical protein
MAQVTPPTTEAEDVQRQMRAVRAELRDDVQELVVSANQMADWKRYVRAYPWLCVGGALAVGFLLVPQRSVVVRPDAEGLIELAKRNKLVVKMEETPPPEKKRGGLLAQLVSLAAATLLQGGLKIASEQFSRAMHSAATHSQGNGRAGVHHD